MHTPRGFGDKLGGCRMSQVMHRPLFNLMPRNVGTGILQQHPTPSQPSPTDGIIRNTQSTLTNWPPELNSIGSSKHVNRPQATSNPTHNNTMAQLGVPPTSPRPPSSYSHTSFHLPSSSSSSPADSDNENEPLPFPAALSRADFLTPSFDPAAYLSALHTGGPASRHQTLEDLRTELRDRGAAISAELLELVNANYTAFLGLGDELQGGGDRAGDVRVALLGFRRAVEELRSRVRERRVEVGGLNGELLGVRQAVEVGRKMLELDERVGGLEARLVVGSVGEVNKVQGVKSVGLERDEEEESDWEEGFEGSEDGGEGESEEEDGEFVCSGPSKLAALAREYVVVDELAESIGCDIPFIKKMDERITRCRNTILLDLSTALKEARKAGPRGQGRVIKFLGIYRVLDAQADAVKVLKEK